VRVGPLFACVSVCVCVCVRVVRPLLGGVFTRAH